LLHFNGNYYDYLFKQEADDYNPSNQEYKYGLERYLILIFDKASTNQKIPCPYKRCACYYLKSREDTHDHLIINGPMHDLDKAFRSTDHGISSMNSNNYEHKSNEHRGDDMSSMLRETFLIYVDYKNIGIDGDKFIKSNSEWSTSEPSNDVDHLM